MNLWCVLLVVYLCLSSTLWKDLLLEGSGRGALRRHCVQKCLRSSQYEQQRLAPGGVTDVCLNIVLCNISKQCRRLQRLYQRHDRHLLPQTQPEPGSANEEQKFLRKPHILGPQWLPWACALVSHLHYASAALSPYLLFISVR